MLRPEPGHLTDDLLISHMRQALSALPGDEIEHPALRCIAYVGAGVELADALRFDDAALKIEKIRRFLTAPSACMPAGSILQ